MKGYTDMFSSFHLILYQHPCSHHPRNHSYQHWSPAITSTTAAIVPLLRGSIYALTFQSLDLFSLLSSLQKVMQKVWITALKSSSLLNNSWEQTRSKNSFIFDKRMWTYVGYSGLTSCNTVLEIRITRKSAVKNLLRHFPVKLFPDFFLFPDQVAHVIEKEGFLIKRVSCWNPQNRLQFC